VGDPATAAANSNPSDARLVMRNNDVIDNYIHDIGVDYMSAAAISAGFPLDMDIRNNEIFNVPYSGMHIGYGWDTRFPNTLRNMKIEHNFIHDFMGKGIYDGGAIYTLGNSGGSSDHYNLVARNYIRNQMNDYGALYPDQGSTFWHFDRNVIDLSETTTWQSGPARWTLGNSNRDVIFSDTYTTTERKVSNSPVCNVRRHSGIPGCRLARGGRRHYQPLRADAGVCGCTRIPCGTGNNPFAIVASFGGAAATGAASGRWEGSAGACDRAKSLYRLRQIRYCLHQ
jgi:hypothetical protein